VPVGVRTRGGAARSATPVRAEPKAAGCARTGGATVWCAVRSTPSLRPPRGVGRGPLSHGEPAVGRRPLRRAKVTATVPVACAPAVLPELRAEECASHGVAGAATSGASLLRPPPRDAREFVPATPVSPTTSTFLGLPLFGEQSA
jgi:hypothetical protein